MKIKIDALVSKVSEYALTQLSPSAKGWLAKCLIGCALPDIPNHVRMVATMTKSVDESGMVDLDRLKTIVMSGFKNAGHLDLFNGAIGFDPPDAEDLFAFIEGQGVQS